VLSAGMFQAASANWIKQIVTSLKGKAPVVVFSKGIHGNWGELAETGANVLGVDHHVPLSHVSSMVPKPIGLQGNLDPMVLTTTPDIVASETKRVLEGMRGRPGHIFNLGHGVTPDAKIENIESLVQTVRSFR